MKINIINKLITSLLVLMLGTSQVAVAAEATAKSQPLNNSSNSNIKATSEKKVANAAPSNSAAELFATTRSPGAIAVGAAEGNLTPAGKTTSIYFGHIDPGNHVTNRGFCSWNKAARLSVEEADRRCLAALQSQSATTERKLKDLGLNPQNHTVALVNGTDLWNQSDSAGPQFASKYKLALDEKLQGRSALLSARVEAFRVSSGQLDASGLFGICTTQPYYKSRLANFAPYSEVWRWQCIALDQGRRIRQVDKALKLNIDTASTYSDPVPDVVSPAEVPKSPSEASSDLPALDSFVLNFEPVVVPLSEVSKKNESKSATSDRVATDDSPLDFTIPQNSSESTPESPTPLPSTSTLLLKPSNSLTSNLQKIANKGDKVGSYTVSSTYGMRIHPITRRSHFHGGVDLKMPANTSLYAIGKPGTKTTLTCWTDIKGGGLVASMSSLSFPNLQFDALHLSWCKAATNNAKIEVNAGEVIAGTGNSGMSTGPHLHFQMRNKDTGKLVSPPTGFISWALTGKEP